MYPAQNTLIMFGHSARDLELLYPLSRNKSWFEHLRTFWKILKGALDFIGFGLRDYFRDTLALRWRGWMTTQYLDKYFENRTFYSIQSQSLIDNPDQRIVDNLNAFTGSALGFALALFIVTINLISFSGILYGIYPPLFYVLVVYSVGGTAISVALGKVSYAI